MTARQKAAWDENAERLSGAPCISGAGQPTSRLAVLQAKVVERGKGSDGARCNRPQHKLTHPRVPGQRLEENQS
jgi:hypothetical protein